MPKPVSHPRHERDIRLSIHLDLKSRFGGTLSQKPRSKFGHLSALPASNLVTYKTHSAAPTRKSLNGAPLLSAGKLRETPSASIRKTLTNLGLKHSLIGMLPAPMWMFHARARLYLEIGVFRLMVVAPWEGGVGHEILTFDRVKGKVRPMARLPH
jgi:hypothetical protein